MSASRSDLKRLRDDIQSLDHSVHQDIYEHLPKAIVSQNFNGAFFDMCQIDDKCLNKIETVVRYAKAVRGKLDDHDRKMFESAQQLVSGPVETDPVCTGARPTGPVEESTVFNPCDGEEAFCTRMETGCVTKPAKGVFVKK
jgi:hypothetical protein